MPPYILSISAIYLRRKHASKRRGLQSGEMRRGGVAGYPVFSDRTRVNANLNKATAVGDLMGFRGILCLF